MLIIEKRPKRYGLCVVVSVRAYDGLLVNGRSEGCNVATRPCAYFRQVRISPSPVRFTDDFCTVHRPVTMGCFPYALVLAGIPTMNT